MACIELWSLHMFQWSVASGSLPAANLLSHIPTFGDKSATVTTSLGVTPTISGLESRDGEHLGHPVGSFAAGHVTVASDYWSDYYWDWLANHPQCKKLLDRMYRWKYIDLTELLPQTSAHNVATPEVDPHCFVLFPGCEFIKPKKHKMDSITEWVKAFTIYMAAM